MGRLSANPNAIHILEQNLDEINWQNLSSNPNAITILEQNLDKLDEFALYNLSANPNAIPILEKHPELIFWSYLSKNPNAIHLLEKNPNKICWLICENPAAFVYDYEAMREANREFKEELIQRAWHPDRVARLLEAGMDLEDM